MRGFDVETVVAAFGEAARCAGSMIDSAAVEAAWDEPSALRRMSVGDIAGHLFLIVRRVGQRLENGSGPAPDTAPAVDRGWTWLPIHTDDDLDHLQHARVRDDGAHIARWGWAAVRDAYTDRLARVTARLAGTRPDSVAFGTERIPLTRYLGTRVAELVIHADDLACSVGTPLTPPPQAVDVATGALADGARQLHGELSVLRALSRPERAPTSLSVF